MGSLRTEELTCPDIKAAFVAGSVFSLEFLAPILTPKGPSGLDERFFPPLKPGLYVRQEMVDVFTELTKPDRKQKQVLIGSPGVGKSVLLFVVALHRALTDDTPVLYTRKVTNTQELPSVFFMTKKKDENKLVVRFNRSLKRKVVLDELKDAVLKSCINIDPADSDREIVGDRVLYFLDGLHQGDDELTVSHHYLSTSGGYDSPVGEASKHASLVVLGGWEAGDLRNGLKLTSTVLAPPAGARPEGWSAVNAMSAAAEVLDGAYEKETFEDIFFHTGGRIREALQYASGKDQWKEEKFEVINKITKEQATLCLIETKGSADPKSPDRIRTMFRNGDYLGGALQIVDSQYYVRILQDRVDLEQYFNAYIHARDRGLSSAAGCHFEELLHELFKKLPDPIEGILEGTGTGREGVSQLTQFSQYWIPSIPNFANIDAAVAIQNSDGSVTLWCPQYTVSSSHGFNSQTFRVKFLRPALSALGYKGKVSVCVYFVVPNEVYPSFRVPDEVEDAGYETKVAFVDCSTVESVSGVFGSLDFVTKPVQFHGDRHSAKKPAAQSNLTV